MKLTRRRTLGTQHHWWVKLSKCEGGRVMFMIPSFEASTTRAVVHSKPTALTCLSRTNLIKNTRHLWSVDTCIAIIDSSSIMFASVVGHVSKSEARTSTYWADASPFKPSVACMFESSRTTGILPLATKRNRTQPPYLSSPPASSS